MLTARAVLTISNSQGSDYEFQVPDCIALALQPLVALKDDIVPVSAREITSQALDNIVALERDSNEGVVDTMYQCDVVADGKEVLRLVVEGLNRRLRHPVDPVERLAITSRDQAR